MTKSCLLAVIMIASGFPPPQVGWPEDWETDWAASRHRSAFEVYLSRADRAGTEEEWLDAARFGLESLSASWEVGAAHLIGQGVSLPAERELLAGELGALLQERFVRWLVKRAFAREASKDGGSFSLAVLQANYHKLYKTDADGIIYDASGDPETYGPENLALDDAEWKAMVFPALESELASWDSHAAAIRTELLQSLPEGTATALFDGLFRATEEQGRSAYRRELEVTFQREESRFLYQRRLDQFSLRRKSEAQTASATVAELIAGVQAETAEGLQRLRDGLSIDRASFSEDRTAVDPAAWQEDFRSELDKGLARWSEAERALLVSRAEWEGTVAKQLQNGEGAWSEAHAALMDARLQWEREIETLLEEGRARWEARQSDLAEAIAAARGELLRSIATQSESIGTRIDNLTRLAAQASEVLTTARSSLAYWRPLLPDPKARGGGSESEQECEFWEGVQAAYRGYYDDALGGLAQIASEINGGGDLTEGELSGFDAVDGRYLDGYQLAILQTRAAADFWQGEMAVAEAVAAYAHDSSSSRPTEALTGQRHQEALDAMARRQDSYEGALRELEVAGRESEAAQARIAELNGKLRVLDEELSEAEAQCQAESGGLDAAAVGPTRARFERLTGEREALAASYDAALSAFRQASDAYAACYQTAQAASDELEAARFALRTAEAVELFASTGYLRAEEATGEEGFDPDRQLEAAREGLTRAQAALEALRSLSGPTNRAVDFAEGDGPEASAYRMAFADYRTQYGSYLALERLSALLDSAAVGQQERVAEARSSLEGCVSELLESVDDPSRFSPTVDLGGSYRGEDFVQVIVGKEGLPDFTFGAVSTSSQKSDLVAYLVGTGAHIYSNGLTRESSYGADRELWVRELSDYLAHHSLGGLLSDWSLALQHQMGPSGLAVAANADGRYRNLFEGYCVDSSEIAVAGGGGGLLAREGVDYEAELETRARAAYLRVMGDPTERELYEFFIAMNLLGLVGRGNVTIETLTDEYRAGAQQHLVDRLSPKEDTYRTAADGLFAAAAVAALVPWTWGFAATFFVAALDYQGKANAISAYIESDLLGSIHGARASVDTAARALSAKTVGPEGYCSLKCSLEDKEEGLALLGGSLGSAGVSADSLYAAVLAAARLECGADASKELEGIVKLANGGIPDSERSLTLKELLGCNLSESSDALDSAGAFTEMCRDSRERRDQAFLSLEAIVARLQAVQAANEATYREAVAGLDRLSPDGLDPSSSLFGNAVEQLQAAAEGAYLFPAYRAQDHLNRLLELDTSLQGLLDPGHHPELAEAQGDLLSAQVRDLGALYTDRMNALLTAQGSRWRLLQEELARQRLAWQTSLEAITRQAALQWDAAFERLDEQHGAWVRQFRREYEDRAATWDAGYCRLQINKSDWVRSAAERGAEEGFESVRRMLAQAAEGGIHESQDLVVADLALEAPDPRAAVASLLSGSDFASLLAQGRLLGQSIARGDPRLLARLGPDRFDAAQVLQRIADSGRLQSEEINRHLSAIVADGARRGLAEAAKAMNDRITQANQEVADNLRRTVTAAGFSEAGDRFERSTVVSSTLVGPVREMHTVPVYRPYFPLEAIRPRVDLSDGTLLSLSDRGIQAQAQAALQDMERQLERVFGSEMGELEKNKDGELWAWIGAAPVMSERPDPSASLADRDRFLRSPGSGQLAAVLTPFLWSQLKEGSGWAQVAMPLYDKKLWDDRGSAIKAPTLRTVAEIGAGVVGTVIAGGLGAALFEIAERGLFTAADVGNGMLSWDEGLFGLGKGILSSAVSFGAGALGTLLGPAAQGLTAVEEVVSSTMAAGLSRVADAVGQGAIGAISYRSGEGFRFDQDSYLESFAGREAVAGYLGAAAGRCGSGFLSGDLSGFDLRDAGMVRAVADLGGGFIDAGTQYAISGQTVVNLLDLADVSGNPRWDLGLLELGLSGSSATLSLGAKGAAIGVGRIGRAVEGMEAFTMQQRIRLCGALGGVEFADGYEESRNAGTALRESYSFGDAAARLQLDRIVGGEDRLRVGYRSDAAGETTLLDRVRTIELATLGRAGDLPSQLAAGIALQHEAYRDGMNDGQLGQRLETTASVLAHIGMTLRLAADPLYAKIVAETIAESPSLQRDLDAVERARLGGGTAALARYAMSAYDSSADYWKLMNDGTLVYDGSGWLRDQVGNLVTDAQGRAVGADGVETGLLTILGERGEARSGSFSESQAIRARSLMLASGLAGSRGTAADSMWSGVQGVVSPSGAVNAVDLTAVNAGKALNMEALMSGWGSTVATEVFFNYFFGSANDAAVSGTPSPELPASWVARATRNGIPNSSIGERYGKLMTALQGFYGGPHLLLSLASPQITQGYGPSDLTVNGKAAYLDSQHKGIDIAGPLGTPEYSLLEGRVVYSGYNSEAGNTAIVDLGFDFEEKFESLGICSQFMHMNGLPSVYVGQSVAGDSLMGYMGLTGLATGPHLHFQLMGAHGGPTPSSPEWEVLRPRRDALLKYLGAPPTSEWTANKTMSRNFWSRSRLNFYFNTNGLIDTDCATVRGLP